MHPNQRFINGAVSAVGESFFHRAEFFSQHSQRGFLGLQVEVFLLVKLCDFLGDVGAPGFPAVAKFEEFILVKTGGDFESQDSPQSSPGGSVLGQA